MQTVGAELPELELGAEEMTARIKGAEYLAVLHGEDMGELTLCDGEAIFKLDRLTVGEDWDDVIDVLFDESVKKVFHGVKDFMGLALKENISPKGFVFDTELAAYLLDSTESSYPVERLAMRHLGTTMPDVQAMYELYPVLDAKLAEIGSKELYYKVELPLCEVLADMERTGFLVDKAALAAYGESLCERDRTHCRRKYGAWPGTNSTSTRPNSWGKCSSRN